MRDQSEVLMKGEVISHELVVVIVGLGPTRAIWVIDMKVPYSVRMIGVVDLIDR